MILLAGGIVYYFNTYLEVVFREIQSFEEETEDFKARLDAFYENTSINNQEGKVVINAHYSFPLKKIVINLDPVQTGNGQPSPSNIRPISSWESCNIYVSPTDDPQAGSTYNVVFPEEVCKGKLIINSDGSGVLTVTSIKKKIKDMNFSYQSSYGVFRTNGASNFTSSADGICSTYNTVDASVKVAAMPDSSIKFDARTWDTNGRIVIKDTRFSNTSDLYAAIGEEEVVFTPQRDMPIIYNLKSEQIKTIVGVNNIWSDAGNISLIYGDYLGVIENFMSAHKEFSSIQQMVRSISGAVDGYAKTTGYYTQGDGGGAKYAIQSSEPSGYYVQIPDGYAALIPDGMVTPEMFGAYGDGVHDDSFAFNTACTWAAYYGVPVVLNAKTYVIGSTVSVGSHCKLKGYGNGLSVLKYTGENICLDVSSYADIDGIRLKCESQCAETIGINVNSTETGGTGSRVNINIKNCVIDYFRKAGINLNVEWQVNIDNCKIRGYSVGSERKCCGILFDYDGVVLSGWAGSGNLITNCYFSYCDYGIFNRGGWDLTLVNDIFEHNDYGIFKHKQGNPTTVIGCWFEDNTKGLSGSAYNVIACRGRNTFDDENSEYILDVGTKTEIKNLVLIGEDGAKYAVSIDSNGKLKSIPLSQ